MFKFPQLEKIAPTPSVVDSFQYFIMKAPLHADCYRIEVRGEAEVSCEE